MSFSWLKWLGEHRDGQLVVTGITYGLGYLVWSYTAWRNGLGQLPALEFQYIVAGLIPGTIIALMILVFTYLPKLQEKLGAYKYRSGLSTALFCLIVLIFLHEGAIIVLLIIEKAGYFNQNWRSVFPQLPRYVYPVALLVFSPAIMFLENRVPRGILWPAYRIIMAFAMGQIALSGYLKIYPDLPQAVGGPSPRCAYLDLVRSKMSSSFVDTFSSSSRQGQ